MGTQQGNLLAKPFFSLVHFHALHYFLGVFLLCLLSSLTNDTHILGLTHIVSSPLIIVFPSWFLWGCLFNLTSVQLGFRLAYLLNLSPYQILLPFSGIRIFAHLFSFVSLVFFFFARGFKQGCLICIYAPEIRWHPCGFWYLLSIFCPKAFLFALLFPPLPGVRSQFLFWIPPY